MRTKSTAKAYFIFLFLLPLVSCPEIQDRVLLPRQLLLSVFVLLLTGVLWKTFPKTGNFSKIDAANLALVGYVILSGAISLATATVLSETLCVLSKLWLAVSFSILTTLLLKANVITSRQIVVAVVVFGCVAVSTALADIVQKAVLGQHLLLDVHYITGGFGNKNLLSSILFLCLPFFMLAAREKSRIKVLSYVALVFSLVILVIVRTRISMVAALIFFGIIALFYLGEHFKRRFWSFFAAFLAVAATGFITLKIYAGVQPSNKMEKYFNRLLDSHTLEERLLFWQNSVAMLREYPIGVGLGNWQLHFPKYGLDKFGLFEIQNGLNTLQRPHNDYLWSLCETGIFGFAVYIAVFCILVYMSFRLIGAADDRAQRKQSVFLFAGIIGFVLISFFDFPMERIEHLVILMLLFSLVIHEYRLKFPGSLEIPIGKKIIFIFLLAGGCFSLTVAFNRFAAERQVFKMYAARADGYDQQALSFAENADGFFYRIDSRTIPLEWYKGVAKFGAGQYRQSEICFEKAYALTPHNIHVINNLASTYEVNGKRREAIAMYSKALKISPNFEEARLNLAAVYFNDKDFEKAFNTIDSCATATRDPKYKTFLPPILKSQAELILAKISSPNLAKMSDFIKKSPDYLKIYCESKKNNVTFERQIIKHLNE